MDREKLVITQREMTEIRHSIDYLENYNHGTVGHNAFVLVAKLAKYVGFSIDYEQNLLLPDDAPVSLVEDKR